MQSYQNITRTPSRQGNGSIGGGSGIFGFGTPNGGGRLARGSYRSSSRDKEGRNRFSSVTQCSPHPPSQVQADPATMSAQRRYTGSAVSNIPVGAMSVGRHFGHGSFGSSTAQASSRLYFTGFQGALKGSDGRGTQADQCKRNECLKSIVRYLSSHNFPVQHTPKSLSSPSKTTYLEIVTFLIKQVDPNLITKFSKVEEDVPRFFKDMGYHTTINKTSMIAPGAPNTWRQHIQAMAWLCDLLVCEQEMFPHLSNQIANGSPPFEDPQDEIGSGRWEGIATAISDSYRIYMTSTDDSECDNDEEATSKLIVHLITSKIAQVQSSESKLGKKLESVTAKTQDFAQQMHDHKTLGERNEALKCEAEKMEKTIAEMDLHLRDVKQDVSLKAEAAEAKDVDLSVSIARCDELEGIISRQGIDRTEVQRINAELKAKKKRLQDMRREKAEKDIEVQEAEAAVESYMHQLRDLSKEVRAGHAALVAAQARSPTPWTCSSLVMNLPQLQLNLDVIENDEAARTVDSVFGCSWKEHKETLQTCITEEDTSKHKLYLKATRVAESSTQLQGEVQQRQAAVVKLQKEVEKAQRALKLYTASTDAQIKGAQDELQDTSLDIKLHRSALQERFDKLKSAKEAGENSVRDKRATLEAIIVNGRTSFITCAKSLVDLKENTREGFASAVRDCELLSKNLPQSPKG